MTCQQFKVIIMVMSKVQLANIQCTMTQIINSPHFIMSQKTITFSSETKVRQRKGTQQSIDYYKKRYKDKKLTAFIFRMAPRIIQYARAFSIRLKKNNSHQVLLFPGSFRPPITDNPDRNLSLIDQYKSKLTDWYPFYFASRTTYIDNHHLQIFARQPDLPNDFTQLGLGKVVCFGEKINFTLPKLRKNNQGGAQKLSIFDQMRKSDINIQQFRQSFSQIRNKLFNGMSQDQQDLEQEIIITNDILFMGTDAGNLLYINSKNKMYGHMKVANHSQSYIKSISVYKNYVLAVCDNTFYFYKFQSVSNMYKITPLFNSKIIANGAISRPQFIKYIDSFYLFFVDQIGLKKMILKERIIANISESDTISASDRFNPFMNMKIFHQASMNRILVTVSCTKQVLIYSYKCKENKHSLLYKMPNPKNPPPIPKMHVVNCIEYFPQPSKEEVGINKRDSITTMKKNPSNNQFQNSQNNGNDQNRQIDGFDDSQYILVAMSFTQRIYFVKIWEDHCAVSKRAKFFHRILKIQAFNEQGVIILLHNQDQKAKNQFQNSQTAEEENNINDQKNNSAKNQVKLIFMTTLVRKLLSFNMCVHTQILQKIQYQVRIPQQFAEKKKFRAAFAAINSQFMVLAQNSIIRVGLNTWYQIYKKMEQTENIQLLNYLILLKNYKSIFLKPPEQFIGLEEFFPKHSNDNKQVLLQYYYEINQQPPAQFIEDILKSHPDLLIPFILEHKVSNLSEESKQFLIQHWKNKDQRIIQQLIMAGCEHGEDMAVSKGWMRALRKRVELGMDIHFPLLKLSSFVVFEHKRLQNLDQIGTSDPDYERKSNEVQQKIDEFCEQIIQYALLALDYFLDPEVIEQLDDLKQFLLTLLSPNTQILQNCFRYRPHSSIRLISRVFKAPQRMVLIDQLDATQFFHIHKQSKTIIVNYLSISQMIFSFMSEKYRELTQVKSYTIEQRTKFRQLLIVQHAKLIRLSMQNANEDVDGQIRKGKFQFTRMYLIEMIVTLVSHNNEYLKMLLHQQNVQLQKDRQQFDRYIQDLLVKIWIDAKNSPNSNTEESTNKIVPMQDSQIKQVMAKIQQTNGSNNYLLIVLMYDLPPIQCCVKILRKFIYCENKIIKQRLFDWMMKTMRDPQCKDLLQVEMMNHLKSIIEINKEKSRELFDEHFRNREKDIIRKIDNDPHLQLQYLEMIISDAMQAESQIEEYYLNLYLKLLIAQQPDRVITVLDQSLNKGKTSKIKYDLQEALKVSLQIEQYAEKNRIQTYLFEKLSEVQKCIGSYLKILQELFWQYIDYYENKEQNKQKAPNQEKVEESNQSNEYQFTKGRRLSKKMSLITQLISNKKYSQNQTKIIEVEQKISTEFKELTDLIFRQPFKKYDYLRIPLDAMINFSQQIRQQKLINRSHYMGMLAFYFGRIIVQSFEKGYLLYFNEWLKTQNRIDLNVLKKYLFEGYQKVISQQNLLQKISQLDKNVLIKDIYKILMVMQKSIYCQAKCTICGYQFEQFKGQCILFNCGHLFHQGCIEQDENGQDYCWECVYQDQIQAMIDHTEMSMVTILDKYCEKKITTRSKEKEEEKAKEVIISTNKKRMNRLGIFDKKVNSIDNQVEILDMKLEILEYYDSFQKSE